LLTPQGRIFLKNARRILYNMEEAITEVQEFGEHMTKKLSIGTNIYCSEIILPVLKNFCEKYPFIVPEIHEGSISYLTDSTFNSRYTRFKQLIQNNPKRIQKKKPKIKHFMCMSRLGSDVKDGLKQFWCNNCA